MRRAGYTKLSIGPDGHEQGGRAGQERPPVPRRRGRRGIINNLRELRIHAGLTQAKLAKRSGVSAVTIGYIEQGRVKPRELTWRALLKALSYIKQDAPMGGEKEQLIEEKVRTLNFCGEVLERDEFFRRLRPKLGESLAAFFNESLIRTFLENTEFFSRQRYYLGDFATAVELLGALLRAQKRNDTGTPAPIRKRPWRKRL